MTAARVHRTRSLGEPSYEPEPGTVPPPGETIAEWLYENRHSQRWLANQLRSTAKHVNRIIKGRAPLTVDYALRLGDVTDVPAAKWWQLACDYTLNQAQLRHTPLRLLPDDQR